MKKSYISQYHKSKQRVVMHHKHINGKQHICTCIFGYNKSQSMSKVSLSILFETF